MVCSGMEKTDASAKLRGMGRQKENAMKAQMDSVINVAYAPHRSPFRYPGG